MINFLHHLVRAAAALFLPLLITPAHAIDWQQIAHGEIILFQPGQASWEWMQSSAHLGASMVKQGRNCRLCHTGQEALLGGKIIRNKTLEPQPLPGVAGSLAVKVKIARDNDRIVFRLSWPASKSDHKPVEAKESQTRLSLFIDDGSVKDSATAGCWLSCHSDNAAMSNSPPATPITKYLAQSRIEMGPHGGGTAHKSASELGKLRSAGVFLEYWQVDLNPGSDPVGSVGTVLEDRKSSAGLQLGTEAKLEDGTWTVVVSRALTTENTLDKDIIAGKVYTFGLAIHENFSRGRQHFVSFENSFALDKGNADFIVAP